MNTESASRLWVIMLALVCSVTIAQENDRMAVLAVMEKAFEAVRTGDPDDWRAIQLAAGTTLSMRPHPDGDPHRQELRLAQNEAFVSELTNDGHVYLERWTSEPTVMLRGPIAVVWGEYDFWIDGEFSHCGVDSADLVKVDNQWKIANFMWTVEKEGCPTDPN